MCNRRSLGPTNYTKSKHQAQSTKHVFPMSESILIVDYERGILATWMAVLRDEGFVAESVASGEECLQALAQRAFGCVLLDVWLPGINGLETLKQMRELSSDAAVVIISGHGNVETAV